MFCNDEVKDCCEKFGLKPFEEVLVAAVQTMINLGSITSAFSIVKELSHEDSASADGGDRSTVCSKLAKIAIDEELKFSQKPTAASLKDLYSMLPANNLDVSSSFVRNVLKQDIRTICIPFVLSPAVGKVLIDSRFADR